MARRRAGAGRARVGSLVVASKVREFLRARRFLVAADLPEALTVRIEALLDEAARRAAANKRRTVRPADL